MAALLAARTAAADNELTAVRSNHARFMLSLLKARDGRMPIGLLSIFVILVRRAAEAGSRPAKLLFSLVAADRMGR